MHRAFSGPVGGTRRTAASFCANCVAPGYMRRIMMGWIVLAGMHAVRRCTRPSWWMVALLLGGPACQRAASNELLTVSALAPGQAQIGETLAIRGDGFALNRPCTVRFRGSVHRAGRPSQAIDLTLTAKTDSRYQLSVHLPTSLQSRICGPAHDASHATFEGEVEVAIAAHRAGAPPVTGTLHGAVLELYPAELSSGAQLRSDEQARRALDFLGIDVARGSGDPGLTIVALRPGGRAARGGLVAGDRLLRAARLSVLQPSDLVPMPSRRLRLEVLRRGRELSVSLPVDGFARRPPLDLDVPAACIGAFALWFSLRAWPPWPFAASFSARLSRWLAGRRAGPSARPRVEVPVTRRAALNLISGALAFIFVGAALISPLSWGAGVEPALGLMSLLLGALMVAAVAALVAGGRRPGGWSLRCGLGAAFERLFVAAPAGVALASVGLEGGLHASSLVAQQGSMPWQWNALANPGFAGLTIALVLTTLPDPAPRDGALSHSDAPRSWHALAPLGVVEWLYVCSLCAVCVFAFLGGGALPDVAARLPDALQASLSALTLLAKYVLLLVGVLLLRAVWAPPVARYWCRPTLTTLLPLSLLSALLAHHFPRLAQMGGLVGWVCDGFGAVSVGLCSLSMGVVVGQLVTRRAPRATGALSPWL